MGAEANPADRPAPPPGARNLVVVVLDSLRYDSWVEAAPPTLAQLGPVERRWSYATWTAPSHYNLLMGLLPHTSPPEVYASEYYKQDFRRYSERLGVEGIEFKRVLPSIFMPTYLRHTLGYRTGALVSMPVLNPHTAINRDFDQLRADADPQRHGGDAAAARVRRRAAVVLAPERRRDPLPVRAPGRGPVGMAADLGRPRRLQAASTTSRSRRRPSRASSSTRPRMRELHERQISAVGHLDGVIARLFDLLPSNTWVIVTSDHGELFGEERYFGHGPVMHEKVLEVPYVEGLVP